MTIFFHKHFSKTYQKSSAKIKKYFQNRLKLFTESPFHPLLNNHVLHGNFAGYRSINISRDIRAVYKVLDEETIEFVLLGTHNELYGE